MNCAPTLARSIIRSNRRHSQKHADILRHQNRLIQNDRPLDDLETAVDAAQNVLSLTHEHILIGLQARAVDDKVRVNFDFVTVVLLDPDVAQVFPDSRAVNEALRVLAQVAKRQAKSRPKKSKTA